MSDETHQKISEIAQRLYDEEGRPDGQAEEHWHRAEEILRQQTQEPTEEGSES